MARSLPVGEVVTSRVSLTPSEHRRRDRLRRSEDRQAYEAAHVLVRQCVAALTGCSPYAVELLQTCPECGGLDHGAPFVADMPDVHVSLSHTEGFVAAIAAAVPCGVDVETVAADRMVAGAMTSEERAWVQARTSPPLAYAQLWTRKEALVKAGALTLDRAVGVPVHQGNLLLGRWRVGSGVSQVLGARAVASWVLDEGGRSHIIS